jgi:hypothetical protein
MQDNADGLNLLRTATFASTVSELIQRALKTTKRWCRADILFVSSDRYVICSTVRKRRLEDFVEPALLHTVLHTTGPVTYLEVVLSVNLTCERKRRISKAYCFSWLRHRKLGKTYDLTPKMARWIYTGAMATVPMCTAESHAWSQSPTEASICKFHWACENGPHGCLRGSR